MNIRLIKQEQFKISRWSGGDTKETAIFPAKCDYLERNFIWRLSSATVETEESSFTKLPDYDRILMVMDGSVVLAHGQERSAALERWQQDCFDGALKTKCFGKMTDYNLIYRKGCEASLRLLEVNNEAAKIEKKSKSEAQEASYGIYCAEGYAIASVEGESKMVKQGQQLVIEFEAGEDSIISVMGEGKCVVSEIIYSKSRFMSEEIPEEKASFEDFITAFKLVHGRNKWSRALSSGRRQNVWYDEALRKKLSFLEKSYFTFAVWVAVILIALAVSAATDASIYAIVAVIIIWSVIHFIAIAPLIYTIVLPKPINAHIKKVSSLNEYEREIFEAQAGCNERVDKLLKKYPSPDDETGESYREKIKKIFK